MTVNKQTFVALDVNTHIEVLINASDYYTQPRPLTVSVARMVKDNDGKKTIEPEDLDVTNEPIVKLTRQRAIMILSALYNESLSQCLHYRRVESPVEKVAIALRDCAIPDVNDISMAEEYLSSNPVDGVVIDISKVMEAYVRSNPWQQWDLVKSTAMLALLGGKDYRIAEWERAHGADNHDENIALSVDIATVINYIQQQLDKLNIPELTATLPLVSMVIDAICQVYPYIKPQTETTLPFDRIFNTLGVTYNAFCEQFINPVIETFCLYYLETRIEKGLNYTCEIVNGGTLLVYKPAGPKDDVERYFKELRQSLDRGDWVSESEQRKLREYERENSQ